MLAPLVVRVVRPGFVVAGGLVLAAVGLARSRAGRGPDSGVASSWPAPSSLALGVAPPVTLATDLVVGCVPPERAGVASGISETGAELGGALGIAVLGSIGVAVYRDELAGGRAGGVPAGQTETAKDTLGGAVETVDRLPDGLGARCSRRPRTRSPRVSRSPRLPGWSSRSRRRSSPPRCFGTFRRRRGTIPVRGGRSARISRLGATARGSRGRRGRLGDRPRDRPRASGGGGRVGRAAWSGVRGKLFAWQSRPRDGSALAVRVDRDEKPLILDSNSEVYFETPHYRGYPAVLIRLENVDRAEVEERIEDAWLIQVPKRLAAEYLGRR